MPTIAATAVSHDDSLGRRKSKTVGATTTNYVTDVMVPPAPPGPTAGMLMLDATLG